MIGDISHSRVVRSNIHLLTKLGANVRVAGPRTMVPRGVEALDAAVRQEQIERGIDPLCRIDHPPAANQERAHLRSSRARASR
jgi:aspartate carbamoyltransferase catalytic subunit